MRRVESQDRARTRGAITALVLALTCACGGNDGAPPDVGPAADTGTGSYGGPPPETNCTGDDFDAEGRKLLWGDLHVHTSQSFDAYFFNSLNDPARAYQYASGQGDAAIVCDDGQVACGTRRLTSPLDFVALTDHAEFLGAFQELCNDPEQQDVCELVRGVILDSVETLVGGDTPIDPAVLNLLFRSPDPSAIWDEARRVADEYYDPCTFTTIHAYEFSPQINGSMMHRNVLFLGDQPTPPFSSVSSVSEWDFFDAMESTCGQRGDCDYLTIPHNSNLSSGRMFRPASQAGRGGAALTAADAQLRANADVLVEITQHKGASECMPGGGFDGRLAGEESDEACRFEAVRVACRGDVTDPAGCVPPETQVCDRVTGDPLEAASPAGCTVPNDFVRGALAEGLRIQQALGTNPYAFGFAGATDTHNGTPGAVDEAEFVGHGGIVDSAPETLLGPWACAPDDPDCDAPELNRAAFAFNPGGLTAVYAQQNTRAGIFEAMRARRTYATSGPRILVRTYVTRDALAPDACARLGSVDHVVAGAPMGSAVPAGAQPPQIVVWAAQAASETEPAAPLERIQIVKGWVDEMGRTRAEVFDVAGAADGPLPNADCSIETAGRPEQLCGTWTDPSFDPARSAYYYVRVLEQPTCRWSTRMCVRAAVDCSMLDPTTGRFPESTGWAGYQGCCNIEQSLDDANNRFDAIQERAWTSPFFYTGTSP